MEVPLEAIYISPGGFHDFKSFDVTMPPLGQISNSRHTRPTHLQSHNDNGAAISGPEGFQIRYVSMLGDKDGSL